MPEPLLDPDLPICDPHHHLWDRATPVPMFAERKQQAVYLLPELLADIGSGHNVVSTVLVEANSFHRAGGPAHLRAVGEVEFANGVAAMSASGRYGTAQVCAGIVARAALDQVDTLDQALDALLAAGNGRLRGVRHSTAFDPDPAVPAISKGAGLYRSDAFRMGFARLAHHGLSFDAYLYHPQIPDLRDLAQRFPGQTIILDHVGTPLGIGGYAGRRDEVFAAWRSAIGDLASCANVRVKLGGLAMAVCGFNPKADDHAPAAVFAELWRPYIETCIEAFGPERCMFESNFPVDAYSTDYATLWNAFKLIAQGCSADEKAWLFHDCAVQTYRIAAPAE